MIITTGQQGALDFPKMSRRRVHEEEDGYGKFMFLTLPITTATFADSRFVVIVKYVFLYMVIICNDSFQLLELLVQFLPSAVLLDGFQFRTSNCN